MTFPTAIERKKNRPGVAPERLITAIERGDIIPITAVKSNHPCHCTTPCLACFCREGSDLMHNGGGR